MKKTTFTLFIAFVFAACSVQQQSQSAVVDSNNNLTVHGKLFTSAFMQNAAEYRALCYQTFYLAKLNIDEAVKIKSSRPLAIITDIDETILNNSAYAVKRGLQGLDYSVDTWHQWTALGIADTMPGALSFLKYAASKGVETFYITNRDEIEREGTLENLKRFGFPFADNNHLILRSDVSSKEARRIKVLETHDVVLLMGDNLADLSKAFDKKTTEERNIAVDKNANLFGTKYIILPNPTYGDWESAIYQYNHKLSPAQKDSAIKSSLKVY